MRPARSHRPVTGSRGARHRPAPSRALPPTAADATSDRSAPRAQIAEIQRSRLLAAAVAVVDECGYPNTTVGHITGWARVSRRTFYELFANREECLAAVLDDAALRVESELGSAALAGLSWRERIRRGLQAILGFLDREPALARVCIVHAPSGGPALLERRDRVLARLAAVVEEGSLSNPRAAGCSAVTAEGLVGAAFMIVHARLARQEPAPLVDVLGELCSLIVLPYLGAAAARRERARPASREPNSVAPAGDTRDPFAGVAMRITYRTARVLEGVGEHPGASNREVARHAGIEDAGQISKLLARLESLGLLVNRGGGHVRGEPNAWALSQRGEQIAQSIGRASVARRCAA